MKLGKRLKHIAARVNPDYDHIWDCCCDHGLLGAALLAQQAAPCIHFVDIVPEIMEQVESKLRLFHPQPSDSAADPQWQVHCLDVSLLPLQQFNGRHLVIIAGIGGELVAELVKVIYHQYPAAHLDFLLCPVHHEFLLRKALIELDFRLKTESLMEENRRFYEVLLVSSNRHAGSHPAIHPVGSLIWQSTQAGQAKIAADYLHKTLQHYKKIQRNPTSDVQHIIDAYSAVRF